MVFAPELINSSDYLVVRVLRTSFFASEILGYHCVHLDGAGHERPNVIRRLDFSVPLFTLQERKPKCNDSRCEESLKTPSFKNVYLLDLFRNSQARFVEAVHI